MSEPAKIEDRVTKLETEIVEVRHLAAKADKEASDNTAVLKGQVGILNSVRSDQIDQGVRLGRLERKVDAGFAEIRGEMHRGLGELDTEMRRGFSVLSKGQDRITELLEARDDPEDA